jgi:hypothetical protein
MEEQSRIEKIREIAIRNEKPFYDVMSIYTKASTKVYVNNFRDEIGLPYGHPSLEQKTLNITERYFQIFGEKQ